MKNKIISGILSALLLFQVPLFGETKYNTFTNKLDYTGASTSAISTPTGNTIYVTTSGNDTTGTGTSSAPVLTFSKAATLMGERGTIIAGPGTYSGTLNRINLAAIKSLVIKKTSQTAVVDINLGQAVSSFTRYNAGTYPKIWYAAITSSPDTHAAGVGGSDGHYIFQSGTTEGTVGTDEVHPLLNGSTTVLPHYRLRVASSLINVNSANALWWFESSTLYISKTDGGDPNGTTYYVPSTVANTSFVYGGVAGTTEYVEIDGINVYYGYYGFDLSNVRDYVLKDTTTFGSYQQGTLGAFNQSGKEIRPRAFANGDDGIAHDGGNQVPFAKYITVDPLMVANGDEGVSGHNSCQESIYGGYMYYNYSGGITPALGAQTDSYGTHTAKNGVGFTGCCTGATGDSTLNVYNGHSVADTWGWFNAGGMVLNSYDGTSKNNVSGIFGGSVVGKKINVYGHQDFNGSVAWLGGTGAADILHYPSSRYSPLIINEADAVDTPMLKLQFPSATARPSAITLTNALTQLYIGYDSSANMRMVSTRALVLGGSDVTFFANSSTTMAQMTPELNFGVGVFSTNVDARIHSLSASLAQYRAGYDLTNFTDLLTGSGGDFTITPSGGDTTLASTLTVNTAGGNISWGTYTPTRSAEANMDANVTMTEAQYMRVGNTVTVSGRFTADPTLTATTTSFEITLPVASNIGAAEDVAGTAFSGNVAAQGAEVIGVAANDTAKVQFKSADVTSQTWSYTFTYQRI